MTTVRRTRKRGELPARKESPSDGWLQVEPGWRASGVVLGIPIPQGSKIVSRYGGMRDSNVKLPLWRERMTKVMSELPPGWEPLHGYLILTARFFFDRPKSAPTRRFPSTKKDSGDVDKLVRAICDSLTKAGVIQDDALVVELHAHKLFCDDGDQARAAFTVEHIVSPQEGG